MSYTFVRSPNCLIWAYGFTGPSAARGCALVGWVRADLGSEACGVTGCFGVFTLILRDLLCSYPTLTFLVVAPTPEQTLTLHTMVNVASAPHTAARACKKCLAREAKRAERKRRGAFSRTIDILYSFVE